MVVSIEWLISLIIAISFTSYPSHSARLEIGDATLPQVSVTKPRKLEMKSRGYDVACLILVVEIHSQCQIYTQTLGTNVASL